MQLKDCIHFYLGCKVIWDNDNNNLYTLLAINEAGVKCNRKGCFIFIDADDCFWVDIAEIKPILKKWKLSNHIISEAARLGPAAYFHAVPYLCREGFDLFGLIESGEALDAQTLKQS